jgi:hypothetical protein
MGQIVNIMKTTGISFRKSIAVLSCSLAIVSFTGNRSHPEDIDAELLLDAKSMLG